MMMMARNRAVCTKMNNIEKKAKFAVVAAKDGERRRDRTRRFPLTERVVLRRSECAFPELSSLPGFVLNTSAFQQRLRFHSSGAQSQSIAARSSDRAARCWTALGFVSQRNLIVAFVLRRRDL